MRSQLQQHGQLPTRGGRCRRLIGVHIPTFKTKYEPRSYFAINPNSHVRPEVCVNELYNSRRAPVESVERHQVRGMRQLCPQPSTSSPISASTRANATRAMPFAASATKRNTTYANVQIVARRMSSPLLLDVRPRNGAAVLYDEHRLHSDAKCLYQTCALCTTLTAYTTGTIRRERHGLA